MKTLTFYKRVSTVQQTGEDKDGLKRQERSFEHFLKTFPNIDSYKIEILSDEGLSAYHGVNRDKGALGLYIARVEAGEYEHGSLLAVDEQSRLSRLPYRVVMPMVWSLEEHGVTIWSIKDNRAISGDDFANDLMLMLNAKGAHEYSAEISRKVSAAKHAQQMNVRVHKTGTLGNVCPYWLQPSGDKFELIPRHVATIQRIFKERFSLMSMSSIAAGLNADNVPLITSHRSMVINKTPSE